MTSVDSTSWQARWDELQERAAAGEPGIAEWLQAMEPYTEELGVVVEDPTGQTDETEQTDAPEETASADGEWGADDASAVTSLLQEYGELNSIPAADRTAEQTARLEEVTSELAEYDIGSPGMLFRTNGQEPNGAPAELDFIAKLMGMPASEGATEESIAAFYKEQTGEDLPEDFFTTPFADQLPVIQEIHAGSTGEAEGAEEASAITSLLTEFGELNSIPAADRTAEQTARLEEVTSELAEYDIGSPGMLFRTNGQEPNGAPAELDFIARLMGMPASEGATEESIAAFYKEQTGEDLPEGFFTTPFADQLPVIQEIHGASTGEAENASAITSLLAEYGELNSIPAADRTAEQTARLEEVTSELAEYDIGSPGMLFRTNGQEPNGAPAELDFIARLMGMPASEGATEESIAAFYKEQTGEDLPEDFFTTPFADQLPVIQEIHAGSTEETGWTAEEAPTVVSLLAEYGQLNSTPEAERTANQTERLEAVTGELANYGVTSPGMLFRTNGAEPNGAPADLNLIARLMGMPQTENVTEESIAAHYKEQTGKDLPEDFFEEPFSEQVLVLEDLGTDTE